MSKPPTIYDVAQRAGVSKSLVSLVLRGSPRVSDEKRAAVLAAVAELDYTPSRLAAGLAGTRTRSVGVVIDEFENLWFAPALAGLRAALGAGGYSLSVADAALNAHLGLDPLEVFRSLRVDGVVLAGEVPAEAAERLTAPTVVLGTRALRLPGAPVVASDEHAGGRLATAHLAELGHRDIVCVTGPGASAAAREAGYLAEMRDRRLSPRVVRAAGTTEAAARAAASGLFGIGGSRAGGDPQAGPEAGSEAGAGADTAGETGPAAAPGRHRSGAIGVLTAPEAEAAIEPGAAAGADGERGAAGAPGAVGEALGAAGSRTAVGSRTDAGSRTGRDGTACDGAACDGTGRDGAGRDGAGERVLLGSEVEAEADVRATPPALTAVFAVNDPMAVGVIGAARDRGIEVPRDLSVVGYDDSPLAAYELVALTSVSGDPRELGEAAGRALVALLEGDADPAPASLLAPSLVVRRSTGGPPAAG